MPLLISTAELQPDMKLHEPIFVNGRVMLQAGRPLSAAEIEALQRRFPGRPVRVEDPVLDKVIEFEDDTRERSIASEVQQRVVQSMSDVRARFAERTTLGGADLAALEAAVNELLAYLQANPTSAALVAECLADSNHLSNHTGNVFYLSMLLGSKVLDYVAAERARQVPGAQSKDHLAMDLTPLGLASMIMDLGLLPLQEAFTSGNLLNEKDQEAVRQHPHIGAAMLPETLSPVCRAIVRTHHENVDGTGYPAKLTGEKLHVFARIVRIADAFDAVTSEQFSKEIKSPARAIWEMTQGPFRKCYDPRLMKAFADMIQPFPIGSKLRLRDGRYAAVVKYNRQDPFRPIAIVAFDAQNRPLAREQLRKPFSLAESEVRIASFRGEDLSYLYSTNVSPVTPTAARFSTPLHATYP